MPLLHRSATLVVAFASTIAASAAEPSEDAPFAAIDPLRVGLDPAALDQLAGHVQQLVEDDQIVGAELHVIQSRRTVLHRAFGHADRDEERPMTVDSIHCVRSMTKPLAGTAIQMLIDEGRLALDAKISDFVPSFDTPKLRDVTVEILLTHTSGLPFSTIRRPLADYRDLADVAREAAEHGPTFRPGAGFQYSDAGTDTLGAVIEQVTDMTAGEFLRERILTPLGMNDSIVRLDEDDPRATRIPSAYSGGAGQWSRHWHPRRDPPIFPLFLPSQSLYATTTDYARFLALWMDRGEHAGQRLLTEAAVDRAFIPGEWIEEYPVGFPGVELTYGHQWMLYHSESESTLAPIAFGHNGSDGTHAWAWPERDLMVLFFTQSRGTDAGLKLERELHTLLIEQDVAAYVERREAEAAAAEALGLYAGLYWDQDVARAYYVITPSSGQLIVERPGSQRSTVKPSGEPGVFGSLRFELPDEGPASAVFMSFRGRIERQVRHQPDETLPSADEVEAMVRRAHGMDRIADVGAILRAGEITGTTKGTIELSFDASRLRATVGGAIKQEQVLDGDRALTGALGSRPREETGVMREQMLCDHPAVAYGGWSRRYDHIEVLKRIESDGRAALLVRTVPKEGPGSTKIVDEDSGLLLGEDKLEFLPGIGYVGLRSSYEDFRDVGGVRLPFRIVSRYANPMLGAVTIEFERGELGEVAARHLAGEE